MGSRMKNIRSIMRAPTFVNQEGSRPWDVFSRIFMSHLSDTLFSMGILTEQHLKVRINETSLAMSFLCLGLATLLAPDIFRRPAIA